MLIQIEVNEERKNELLDVLSQFKSIIENIKIIESDKEVNYSLYKIQEESGFAKNVLASSQEDIWNEI